MPGCSWFGQSYPLCVRSLHLTGCHVVSDALACACWLEAFVDGAGVIGLLTHAQSHGPAVATHIDAIIQMHWAPTPDGPWTEYNAGGAANSGLRGVLDLSRLITEQDVVLSQGRMDGYCVLWISPTIYYYCRFLFQPGGASCCTTCVILTMRWCV